MAEQLGGLVGIAAVVAEGVADGGRGIGCQGVGGYLKPALAAQCAGDGGGHRS